MYFTNLFRKMVDQTTGTDLPRRNLSIDKISTPIISFKESPLIDLAIEIAKNVKNVLVLVD